MTKFNLFLMILVISLLSFIEAKPTNSIEKQTTTNDKEKIMVESSAKESEPLCDDCVIDYDEVDEARNEFDEVWDELDGESSGFPIRAVFYLCLIIVCTVAVFGLSIFFCIKIFC